MAVRMIQLRNSIGKVEFIDQEQEGHLEDGKLCSKENSY
jgi:hypothetical protein